MSKVDWSAAPWANIFYKGEFLDFGIEFVFKKSESSGELELSDFSVDEILESGEVEWRNFHWYCLTFESNGRLKSEYFGLGEKDKINKEVITSARKMLYLDELSVLISVSYLGCMSEREFGYE